MSIPRGASSPVVETSEMTGIVQFNQSFVRPPDVLLPSGLANGSLE